jgi:hypothetical protein
MFADTGKPDPPGNAILNRGGFGTSRLTTILTTTRLDLTTKFWTPPD